jgi:hypothetical protein
VKRLAFLAALFSGCPLQFAGHLLGNQQEPRLIVPGDFGQPLMAFHHMLAERGFVASLDAGDHSDDYRKRPRSGQFSIVPAIEPDRFALPPQAWPANLPSPKRKKRKHENCSDAR